MKIFPLGDNDVAVYGRHKIVPGKSQNITYVNVHQDELASVDAAFVMVDNFGGYFWRLRSREENRLISFWLEETGKVYTFDPNRIFTEEGCERTLRENGPYDLAAYLAVRMFAKWFLDFVLNSKSLIVAVHNNKGGDYSALAYLPCGQYGKDCAEMNISANLCPYDFILTTNVGIYQRLADIGLNVILQDNYTVADDGSLSVYCGKNDIPYVNVEAQVGHLGEQLAMLQLLQQTSRAYP